MLLYKDLTKYFGASLLDKDFQVFLKKTFSDLTEYNILESEYIISFRAGIELGFQNDEALFDYDENVVFEQGNPIFSHFNLYSKSSNRIDNLPFDISFDNNRTDVIGKAGTPTQTKNGYADFLNKHFLVDNYKLGNIVISFDYDPEKQSISSVQIRDNNLVEHLKI